MSRLSENLHYGALHMDKIDFVLCFFGTKRCRFAFAKSSRTAGGLGIWLVHWYSVNYLILTLYWLHRLANSLWGFSGLYSVISILLDHPNFSPPGERSTRYRLIYPILYGHIPWHDCSRTRPWSVALTWLVLPWTSSTHTHHWIVQRILFLSKMWQQNVMASFLSVRKTRNDLHDSAITSSFLYVSMLRFATWLDLVNTRCWRFLSTASDLKPFLSSVPS